MAYEGVLDIVCEQDGCEASVKNHYWGKVKAEGWFFARTGEAWCPEHTPEWVHEWRARRDAREARRKARQQ